MHHAALNQWHQAFHQGRHLGQSAEPNGCQHLDESKVPLNHLESAGFQQLLLQQLLLQQLVIKPLALRRTWAQFQQLVH